VCSEREKRSLTTQKPFSVPGRIGTLVFSLPGLLTINRYGEIAISALFTLYLFLMLKPGRKKIINLRTFIWLAPALILSNALLGPAPRILNLFSTPGALNGIFISYRLLWGVLLTAILITACPQEQLIDTFNTILGIRGSYLLTTTLQLVPIFADIRISEMRHLPDAIAQRLKLAEDQCRNQPPLVLTRKRLNILPRDLLILIPAALSSTVFIIF
jgi:hypothetical protein